MISYLGLQTLWAGRPVVHVSVENPPNSLWDQNPLKLWEPWLEFGSQCCKAVSVYTNGHSRNPEHDREELLTDWPGGHPLRKYHRIGCCSVLAPTDSLRLNLWPVCGRGGHLCAAMLANGVHVGCAGNHDPDRAGLPHLEFWKNCLATETVEAIQGAGRALAGLLHGESLEATEEACLEAPSGFQSFSMFMPGGASVVSIDLKKTFKVPPSIHSLVVVRPC